MITWQDKLEFCSSLSVASMTILQKLIISLCIAGASSCFTLVIYREITHKKQIIFEDQDDSDFDYNELSFKEGEDTFKWEVIEQDGETFVVIDDNSDEDLFEEVEPVTNPNKACYIYKYPKKLIHLI
jgi:hypothetical protein